MALLVPIPDDPLHAQVLAELDALGRAHSLVHDLAVGRLILDRFWAGDGRAFSSKAANKEFKFKDFCAICDPGLQELGHTPDRLNKCVRAYLVWQSLPPGPRERLLTAHLVELARCPDPTMRARLALSAVETRWAIPVLRDAVSRANAGRWYDTDEATPGTQPPPPPPPGPGKGSQAHSARRLVTRGEKILPEVGKWLVGLRASDLGRLDSRQRERLGAVLEGLEGQVAELRELLRGGGR